MAAARFHDRHNVPPQTHYYLLENDLWVSIGSPEPSVPAEAATYKDTLPGAYPQLRDESGLLSQMEWALSPDWYRRDTHWKAWIPTAAPAAWYDLKFNGVSTGSVSVCLGGQYLLPTAFRLVIEKDSQDANHILSCLYARMREDVRMKAPILLPSQIETHSINQVFDDVNDFNRFFTGIQRDFLQILAGIRWLMAIDEDIYANLGRVSATLEFDVQQRLEDWRIPQEGGRGVLVDFLRDWREINVALYIEHGIPVHYMWTPELQSDMRFRALSPSFMGAFATNGMPLGSLPTWAHDTHDPAEPLLTSFASDQFLQLRHPMDIAPVKLQGPGPSATVSYFVIDFEGWKARSIFKTDNSRYLEELWYEEERGFDSFGWPWARRTFHRYRPRFDTYDEYSYINSPTQENLSTLREIHKFHGCPPPFHRYIPPSGTNLELVNGPSLPPHGPLIVPMPRTSSPVGYDSSDEGGLNLTAPSSPSRSLPPSRPARFTSAQPYPRSNGRGRNQGYRGQLQRPPRGVGVGPMGRERPHLPPQPNKKIYDGGRGRGSYSGWDDSRGCGKGIGSPKRATFDWIVIDEKAAPSTNKCGDGPSVSTWGSSSNSGWATQAEEAGTSGWGDDASASAWHSSSNPDWNMQAEETRTNEWNNDASVSNSNSGCGTRAEVRPLSSRSLSNSASVSTSEPFSSSSEVEAMPCSSAGGQSITPLPSGRTVAQQTGPQLSAPAATRTEIQQLMCPITPGPLPLPIATINCHCRYLTLGVLIIGPASEARLRYRAMLNDSWTIHDVIADAIQRGIPFDIAVKRHDVPQFGHSISPQRPLCYTPGFQDRSLVWTNDSAKYCDDWLQAIVEILARPHARVMLFRGGLLWRIAREYGPAHLYSSALEGPSVGATCFGQFAPGDPTLLVEDLNEYKIPVLLGRVVVNNVEKYLWPPIHLFEQLDCWTGEWNTSCEVWFQKVRMTIQQKVVNLKTAARWSRDSRFRDRDRVDTAAVLGTACNLFTQSNGSWSGRPVVDCI